MKIETGTGCKLYTLNEFELEQHEEEIRKQERQKVIAELEVYKRALRLASENALYPLNCNRWGDFESQLSKTTEYFLNQARKELENDKN